MYGCCNKKASEPSKKSNESFHKKLVSDLKSSIFCGVKGFLTFSLASSSYLEYSFLAKQRQNSNQYKALKKGAAFAMKKNIIPFLEMIAIVPVACILSNGLLQCVLMCLALMITVCFLVRTFGLRERLLERFTGYSKEDVKNQYSQDSIKFPVFNKERKHIGYNSPDSGQLLSEEKNNNLPYLSAFLILPIKILQSCIMLSLAFVNLLEAIPSLLVDAVYDRTFSSTQNYVQKFGLLSYGSLRNVMLVNIIPMTKFDEAVAEFIGTPKATCCGV